MGYPLLVADDDAPDSAFEAEEKTRDVRRTFYLASAVFLELDDVRAVLRSAIAGELSIEDENKLRSVIVRHLELAWNDGAAREADLRTALSVSNTKVNRLQARLHEALKRISDGR